ncbi:MAG: hypothetical protein GY719_38400 [bacterium]|nr:hypothetical protein [bacterium]
MTERLVLELPWLLALGVPVVVAILVTSAVLQRRRGLAPWRVTVLLVLRGLALLTLVLLAARPTSIQREDPSARQSVALLLDRSKSMALIERGESRFERLVDLTENTLVTAFEQEGWEIDTYLFADAAAPASPGARAQAIPDGPRTDLGGAIAQAVRSAPTPPLAVVAVTDGAANDSRHNRAALLSLVETATPFVGVGLGDDEGVASLSLERLTAPPSVPPNQQFRVAAHLQAISQGEIPAFDLVLLRDGLMVQSRRVETSRGSRLWSESFPVTETDPGVYDYTVEMQLPDSSDLVSVSTTASRPVKVADEKEFRILFAQGALTWNFKFIARALRSDPTVRLTGLSRTSEQSVFRQNVESAGELLDGFPEDLAELAPYRVVVLSDLSPKELNVNQQEVVARFAGELGGGVLLIGGASTFDGSWQASRLEGLLPVTFDSDPGIEGLDRPFHLQLTEAARRHPVFRVDDGGDNRAVWEALPTFTQYGRVSSAKPGASVWARHGTDATAEGQRILMASQQYGAGLSAVISIQNLWRWRLAKDSDPLHFDRFWKQLLRYLGQSGGQEVSIQFPDQERAPGMDVTALVERRATPEGGAAAVSYTVRVTDPSREVILEQSLDLVPLRPVAISFRAEDEGLYSVTVAGPADITLAAQPLEIKGIDHEMMRTGRDMENLRQWASVSSGLALPIEDCRDASVLISQIKQRVEALRDKRLRRVPQGISGWTLLWLLACLGGEWALRRKWQLA